MTFPKICQKLRENKLTWFRPYLDIGKYFFDFSSNFFFWFRIRFSHFSPQIKVLRNTKYITILWTKLVTIWLLVYQGNCNFWNLYGQIHSQCNENQSLQQSQIQIKLIRISLKTSLISLEKIFLFVLKGCVICWSDRKRS